MRNKKKLYMIFNILAIFIVLFNIGTTVFGSGVINKITQSGQEATENIGKDTKAKNGNNDFWGNATSWFNKANTDFLNGNSNADATTKEIISTMENMVLIVGTTVIVIATIFLGIRFMFGSVNSKADAKEGLMNLLVACIFFFGWNSIKNLLFPGNSFIFVQSTDTSYANPVGRVYNIVVYIAQFAAIIAILYVGVKYIFAGVQGKTELKEKSGTFIIGIILAFCSTGFLTYISNVINQALQ